MDNKTTLKELARQYRESANKLRQWLKEHEGPCDDILAARRKRIITAMYTETAAMAKYLESYYQGNRKDSRLYNVLNITNTRNVLEKQWREIMRDG